MESGRKGLIEFSFLLARRSLHIGLCRHRHVYVKLQRFAFPTFTRFPLFWAAEAVYEWYNMNIFTTNGNPSHPFAPPPLFAPPLFAPPLFGPPPLVHPICFAIYEHGQDKGISFVSLFQVKDVSVRRSVWVLRMNSVSPSAAQYVGSGMHHDDLVDGRRVPATSAQVLESRGRFGNGLLADGNKEGPGEPDDVDRLKLKLLSAWNNVKYGSCTRAFHVISSLTYKKISTRGTSWEKEKGIWTVRFDSVLRPKRTFHVIRCTGETTHGAKILFSRLVGENQNCL